VLCFESVEGDRLGDADDEEFRRQAVLCLDGLYGFALSLSHDRSVAQDLVQETYLRAFAAPHRASPGENLRGWLFTILHNVWRNEVRRRKPAALEDAPALALGLVAPGGDALDRLSRNESRERLLQAMAALPESFREVIVLRCVEGFSYRDLASILGCPAGTVMSRLARARALLRRSLAAGQKDHGAA
jgi:RNA polymerase sigma-70 factor (ECF subfamily)